MRLRLTNKFTSAAIAVAFVAATATVHAASPQGEYIVSSEVVSDTATPVSTTYVGDMQYASGDCAGGDCGGCQDGTCSIGGCENGQCGSACGNGKCGLGGGLCGGVIGDDGLGIHVGDRPSVGCQPRKYDRPDLFYNYYSQGNCNRANAQMYLSPHPVPPSVGHTYFTYQPFYPHEYMYWHKNRFHNYYDNGRGLNRTKAVYYAPPIHTAIENFYWNKLRLPR